MIGTLISLSAYLIVGLIVTLWLCLRIARESPLLAVVTFFFWPVAVLPLMRNWGGENDIRVPFFLLALVTGLVIFMALRTYDKAVEEVAPYMSDADLAQVRQDDPELAARIDAARAANPDAVAQARQADALADALQAEMDGTAPPKPDPKTQALAQEAGAERRALLREAAGLLQPRRGTIRFERFGATLQLPVHFRFVPRNQLYKIAQMQQRELPRDVLGWITHERINLGAEKIWYLDVRYQRIDPMSLETSGTRDFSVISAGAPVKGGELRYGYHGYDGLPNELGVRATRLMATRTTAKR